MLGIRSISRPLLLAGLLAASGCDDTGKPTPPARGAKVAKPAARPATKTRPATKSWIPKPIGAPSDPAPRARANSAAPDSASGGAVPVVARPHFVLSPADSAKWPVKAPAPLAGAILPRYRIIAYYGNPLSKRMGVLGGLPSDEMLAGLERTAKEWAKADTGRKVLPALHLIATVAQGRPGAGGKHRLRMSDSLIERVAGWAEQRGWLLFVDIQIGHSTVAAELEPLVPFLKRPYIHLALDPEFAMTRGGVPGRRIGTLDGADVNVAIRRLATLVTEEKLPPKVLVVHRFTQGMLTGTDRIRLDPRVQVVIDMDGFGASWHKEYAYRRFISPYPVQYTGFKLFYRNDRNTRARAPGFEPSCVDTVYRLVGCGDDGLMTPRQVLRLYPQPLYIQYQ
jgi:hypothetical protein